MLELYSFVDYFTIPPSFVSIYLDRTWIGTRHAPERRYILIFRSEVSPGPSSDDCSRYFTILKYSQNFHLYQVSLMMPGLFDFQVKYSIPGHFPCNILKKIIIRFDQNHFFPSHHFHFAFGICIRSFL